MAKSFLNDDTEALEYAPGFRPEDDGVQWLTYTLPPSIWRCHLTLPNDVPAISKADLTGKDPPSAVVAVSTGRSPTYYFQAIDHRNTLREGRSLLFNPHGFKLIPEIGITLPDRIDALHRGGKLYFRSEATVRRFLDLDQFFRAATDREMEQLFQADAFAVDDWAQLQAVANTPQRRKLNAILSSGRTFTAAKLQKVAKKVGISVKARNGSVVVPTTKVEFRNFVRLIDDAYLQSLLDEEHLYLTTSKRPVKANGYNGQR